jgi:hypothetical protein
MIFILICFAGLMFVVLALSGAARRRDSGTNDSVNDIPPVINEVEPSLPDWQKDTNVLAADRAEYFELLEKHSADPLNLPPPIPPSKPHPYWGNEDDVFGYKADADEEAY